jgi:hypothetical protein
MLQQIHHHQVNIQYMEHIFIQQITKHKHFLNCIFQKMQNIEESTYQTRKIGEVGIDLTKHVPCALGLPSMC